VVGSLLVETTLQTNCLTCLSLVPRLSLFDYEFAVIHESDFGIMGPRTKEFDRCRATAVWATCSNFRTTQGTARTVEAVIRDDKTLTVKDADGLFIESLDSALKSDYRNTFLEKAGVAYIVLIPNDPFAFPKLFGVTKKTDLDEEVYIKDKSVTSIGRVQP